MAAALLFFQQQMRQGLHGFAEAHVVGQDAGEFLSAEELQPVEAGLLVGAQRADKVVGRFHFGDAIEIGQGMAQGQGFFAAQPASGQIRISRFKFGELAGLHLLQPQLAIVEHRSFGELHESRHQWLYPRRRQHNALAIRQPCSELCDLAPAHGLELIEVALKCGEQNWQQVDALAIDDYPQFHAKPVGTGTALGNLAIPALRFHKAEGKAQIGLHNPAELLQARDLLVLKILPFLLRVGADQGVVAAVDMRGLPGTNGEGYVTQAGEAFELGEPALFF